MRISDGY